jgi:hypothetical protein
MFFRPGTTRIPFKVNEQQRKAGRRLQRIELDLANDRHALAAVEAYADSCALEMPWLAELLRETLTRRSDDLSGCAATVQRVFGLAQDWAAAQPDYAHGAWEHVRIHLDAALTRRLKPQNDDENDDGEVDAERFAPTRTG